MPAAKTRSRSRGRARSKSPGRRKSGGAGSRSRKTTKASSSTSRRSSSRTRRSVQPKPEAAAPPAAAPARRSSSRPRAKTPVKKETPTRVSQRIAKAAETAVASTSAATKASTTFVPDFGLGTRTSVPKTRDREPGGAIGAVIFALILAAFSFYLILGCNASQCSVRKLPVIPRTLATYLDLKSAFYFFAFIIFQAVILLLPLGPIAETLPLPYTQTRLRYRCNGLLAFVLTAIGFGVQLYLKRDVNYWFANRLRFLSEGLLFALVASVLLYIRARRQPNRNLSATGNSGSILYDGIYGHELNPRFGYLDVKQLVIRCSVLFYALIAASALAGDWQATNGKPNPALAVVALCQIATALDILLHENRSLTTTTVTREGVGFICLMSIPASISWVPSIISYIVQFNVQARWYTLLATVIAYLLGYMMSRGANNQKDEFKRTGANGMDVILVSGRRGLLVSGWWRFVRHPNYLGDLMMVIAWTLPCGVLSPFPWLCVLFSALYVVARARQEDRKMEKRYGRAAWDRYTARVRFSILPYVF